MLLVLLSEPLEEVLLSPEQETKLRANTAPNNNATNFFIFNTPSDKVVANRLIYDTYHSTFFPIWQCYFGKNFSQTDNNPRKVPLFSTQYAVPFPFIILSRLQEDQLLSVTFPI